MQDKILQIEKSASEKKKAFSLWIDKSMKEKQFSNAKLADYLGESRQTIYNWRKGKAVPQHFNDTAIAISEFLNVPPFIDKENTISLTADSHTGKVLISTLISIRNANLLPEFVEFVSDKRFADFLRDCKKLNTALYHDSKKPRKKNHEPMTDNQEDAPPLRFPIIGERMTDKEAAEILANHAAKNLYPLILEMFELNP